MRLLSLVLGCSLALLPAPARAATVQLLLTATTPEVAETSPGGGWRFGLSVRNPTRGRHCLLLPVALPPGLTWALTDEAGGQWQPTFLPPPMPPAGWPPPPRRRCLAAGAEVALGALDGLSGFTSAAHPARWYHQPPAGRYRVRIQRFALGKHTLDSSEATVRVRPADAPVDGLRLALAASAPVARIGTAPVTLRLTFVNVGSRPLRLFLRGLVWNLVELHVDGPGLSITAAQPPALPPERVQDTLTLAPGRTHEVGLGAFPPGPGRKRFALTRPGWYRVRATYATEGSRIWTGKASSSFVWIEVRAPGAP